MKEHRTKHRCPACERAFKSILDYPRARIISVTPLPIPEAVDTMSGAAAEKWLAKRREQRGDPEDLLKAGINRTPEIQQACESADVKNYLQKLSGLVGKEVATRELLPDLKRHRLFRWAYPLPGTDIYLSVKESDDVPECGRLAEVQVLCEGPNMGSAGGPTLQFLGPIISIAYEGLLSGRTSGAES